MTKSLLLAGFCAAALGTAMARAENAGNGDPALLLDAITTFATQDAARTACGRDEVVWADRYAGYYYTEHEEKFGATGAGAYACRRDATRGNYWDTNPVSAMAGHPGRVFPFTPIFVGS